MADQNVKLTVDTSQAQVAIKGLNTAWVNASAQLNVVGKSLDFIAGKWAGLNKVIEDSGRFMDMVKDDAGVASVQMALSVTEGQIKPMELARQQNVLMQGSLKLTQDQFDLVAKSAIALADATGGDAGQAFADLSGSLVKGTTKALSQFGIQIEEGGTKAEKTQKILAYLTQEYGNYSVSVDNAADATDKMNSTMELQQMLAARTLDGMSKTLSKFKTYYMTEFVPGIIDALAGTKFSVSAQLEESLTKMGDKLTSDRLRNEQDIRRSMQETGKIFEINGEMRILYNARQAAAVKDILKNLAAEEEGLKAQVKFASQNGLVLENNVQIYDRLKKIADDRLKIEKQFSPTLQGEQAMIAGLAATYEKQLLPVIQSIAKTASALWNGPGKPAKPAATTGGGGGVDPMIAKQEELNRKLNEMEKARDAEWTKINIDGYNDRLKVQETNRETYLANVASEQAKLQEIANAEKELRKKAADKEYEERLAAYNKDLAARKEYVAKSKELVEGLATVSINAIFAEKKAREGLSRTDYVLKQLAAYMKGEALKYAAKSIGYLAEGIAATFWNPPAAAAAFKASAVSAAASVAFGGGAVAASAMGGNAKSSSGAGTPSSSKTPQRETMAGTSTQRTEVTVILGGRGVVIGDQDELARTISNLLGSANRRGVTRG